MIHQVDIMDRSVLLIKIAQWLPTVVPIISVFLVKSVIKELSWLEIIVNIILNVYLDAVLIKHAQAFNIVPRLVKPIKIVRRQVHAVHLDIVNLARSVFKGKSNSMIIVITQQNVQVINVLIIDVPNHQMFSPHKL